MEASEEIIKKIAEEISATELLIKKYQENAQPIAPDEAIGRVSRMDAINKKRY